MTLPSTFLSESSSETPKNGLKGDEETFEDREASFPHSLLLLSSHSFRLSSPFYDHKKYHDDHRLLHDDDDDRHRPFSRVESIEMKTLNKEWLLFWFK